MKSLGQCVFTLGYMQGMKLHLSLLLLCIAAGAPVSHIHAVNGALCKARCMDEAASED